jgi:hypothetical protein
MVVNMTNNNQYENRLVAFIDMLGFKERVSHFQDDPKLFEWTLNILKAIKAQKQMVYGCPEDLNIKMEFTAFSDSIVLSSRIPEDPINTALFQVAFICSLLLRAGLFARGAIVENYLYHKENIIVGQGIIDAHKQEEEKAIFPRVIISENIVAKYNEEIQISELKEKISTWSNTLIRKDSDGFHFIDTLHSIPSIIFKNEFIPFLESTKNIIITRIQENRNNEPVLKKYEWFKNYFNATITEHPEYKINQIAS